MRGLYDFEGESSDELPFRRGETIRVLEKVSEEWSRGELHGRTGIFPTNYVVRLSLSPSHSPLYRLTRLITPAPQPAQEELPDEPSPAPAPYGSSSHAAPAAANPDAAEADIFAQAAAVDKLLALMHQLRARGEDFADNEELTVRRLEGGPLRARSRLLE